jgi:hypothetical protein
MARLVALRLGRILCGKPLAFRDSDLVFCGSAAEAKPLSKKHAQRKAGGFPQRRRPSRSY